MTRTRQIPADRYSARPVRETLDCADGHQLHMAHLRHRESYVTTFYGDTLNEAVAAASAEATRLNAHVRHAA